jgi:RNA polymerase sigma factor (sigma-70 family)
MVHPDDDSIIAGYLRSEPEAERQIDDWIAAAAWPFQQLLASDWEDALQEARLETFITFKKGSFRGESKLKTFVARITCNTCIDWRRAAKARGQVEEIDEETDYSDVTPGKIQALPDQELEKRERWEIYQRILTKLSPDCHKRLEMFRAGMSRRQMGQLLGAKPETVGVQVFRCLQQAGELARQLTGK